MFYPLSEKNKFGYYSVGDFKTYTKFEAIQISITTGQEVHWHFNDEIFESCDWTKEPVETLPEIYRRRAQQIREKYDYIVLLLSGGSDSTNLIHSFIDNNIPVDEILCVHELDGAKNKHWYMTGEVFYSALPLLDRLLSGNSFTKVRLVDASEWTYNAITGLNEESRLKTYYEFNTSHNIGNLARLRLLREKITDFKSIIDSGKKLCLVWGEAKPNIFFDQKTQKHKFKFEEMSYDMICPPHWQKEDRAGYHDEMFYHSPNCPELMIKQAHTLLKYLKDVPKNQPIMLNLNTTPSVVRSTDHGCPHPIPFDSCYPGISGVHTVYNNQKYCIKYDDLNSIIYPTSSPITYCHGKGIDKLYHPRDEWIRRLAPEDCKKWYNGYIHEVKNFSDHWTKYHGNLRAGLKRLTTEYFLE